MVEEMRDLVEYDDWANARLLEAVAQLSPDQLRQQIPSSFPGVLATLQHMLGSEAVWFRRWQGAPADGWPADLKPETVAEVEAFWLELRRERNAWLDRLSDEVVSRDLPYVNLRGEPFSQPLAEQIRHVVNHSTYHRGQIVTMLHELGVPAVNTDLIAFYRARPWKG